MLDPIKPGDPVPVIPKTATQMSRSAWYTTLAGAGMALLAIGEAFVQFEPQLAMQFPKWSWLPKLATAIGMLLLASQRFGAVGTETPVNFIGTDAMTGKQQALGGVIALGSVILGGIAIHNAQPVPPISKMETAVVAPEQYPAGVLPDFVKTPGVSNPAVTDATINTTIAVSGWTATVRPPASYTDKLKRQQLAGGYAINGDTNLADYEEDHFWPIETGGSPTDPKNLWPSLWHNRYGDYDLGMKTKDVLETKIKTLIVKRQITLSEGQSAFKDWPAAYKKYVAHDWPKWKQ